MTYYFIRHHKVGFAPVKEPCYSLEQAEWLADNHFSLVGGKLSDYKEFKVAGFDGINWTVVKDYIYGKE